MKRFVFGLAVLTALGGRSQAATIIYDYSPGTTGAETSNGWTNVLGVQTFAESVLFAQGATVTGMDIYIADFIASNVSVGDSATIRLFSDNGGQPGALLANFAEAVSAVDTQGADPSTRRVHVDFTAPLSLNAGTIYWIGMAGTFEDFTQSGLVGPLAPDDSRMAQFNGGGTTFSYFTDGSVGDMAFRLSGELGASAVPEPATTSLLAAGAFGALAFRLRRRKAEPAAAA